MELSYYTKAIDDLEEGEFVLGFMVPAAQWKSIEPGKFVLKDGVTAAFALVAVPEGPCYDCEFSCGCEVYGIAKDAAEKALGDMVLNGNDLEIDINIERCGTYYGKRNEHLACRGEKNKDGICTASPNDSDHEDATCWDMMEACPVREEEHMDEPIDPDEHPPPPDHSSPPDDMEVHTEVDR